MICLGLNNQEKLDKVREYSINNNVSKILILSLDKFRFPVGNLPVEYIEWAEIVKYKFFYRLLQEINKDTLVVINECSRTQNRHDLTYNCIRHFLNQAGHQIVFQYLPIIDNEDDFMILIDFDTRSRWKREKFRPYMLDQSSLCVSRKDVAFNSISVEVGAKMHDNYQAEKEKLINNIGLKDPHTIPRNLYLMSGKAKLGMIDSKQYYIGRNNRLKTDRLQTYKENTYPNQYTIFEFCHNFIDFIDFLTLSRQTSFDVLVADLKVDCWYLERYQQWVERLNDCYSKIQRPEKCLASGAGAD